MKPVFADTYYYLALLSSRDEAHRAAVEFTEAFDGTIVTTEWVLTELADGLAAPAVRKPLVRLIDVLRADPAVTIVPCGEVLFEDGYSLYSARMDKAWSLTDCVSFVVMKEHGLELVSEPGRV